MLYQSQVRRHMRAPFSALQMSMFLPCRKIPLYALKTVQKNLYLSSSDHLSVYCRGMYWAWITMLTIGYGDVVPMTTWGKVVGSVCAVIGLVFWSIPMTFVSDKFDLYRRLYKDRDYLMGLLQKLTSEAKEELQQESLMRQ